MSIRYGINVYNDAGFASVVELVDRVLPEAAPQTVRRHQLGAL